MAEARHGKLEIRPCTAARVDDVKTVTKGTWGTSCWDLFPRYTAAQQRALGIKGGGHDDRRRAVLAKLARRRKNSAGLVAYENGEPVGFISLGPRHDYSVIAKSRATPPVDDVPAWVIPCITVRKQARGRGLAVALIRAAVDYAASHGAVAVEAYPRASSARVQDDYAFYGTQRIFRRAGFRVIARPPRDLPATWTPRVTMRLDCATAST